MTTVHQGSKNSETPDPRQLLATLGSEYPEITMKYSSIHTMTWNPHPDKIMSTSLHEASQPRYDSDKFRSYWGFTCVTTIASKSLCYPQKVLIPPTIVQTVYPYREIVPIGGHA